MEGEYIMEVLEAIKSRTQRPRLDLDEVLIKEM